MSKNLYWSRLPVEPVDNSLYSLKRVIAERIWKSDGSSGQGPKVVGTELLPFLEGIRIGNGAGDLGRDAAKLINAIKKYGEVKIYIN